MELGYAYSEIGDGLEGEAIADRDLIDLLSDWLVR